MFATLLTASTEATDRAWFVLFCDSKRAVRWVLAHRVQSLTIWVVLSYKFQQLDSLCSPAYVRSFRRSSLLRKLNEVSFEGLHIELGDEGSYRTKCYEIPKHKGQFMNDTNKICLRIGLMWAAFISFYNRSLRYFHRRCQNLLLKSTKSLVISFVPVHFDFVTYICNKIDFYYVEGWFLLK